MILVTVGMHSDPFDRLVRAADEMASRIDEEVIIQRGTSTYLPRFARYKDFSNESQMHEWIFEARAVIAHGGAGTILDVMASGKPLVLIPREARLGEHIDDHQFELAGALAARGQAVVVTDLSAEALAEAIAQAEQLNEQREIGETGLHIALRDWLAHQAAGPPSWRLRFLRRVRNSEN